MSAATSGDELRWLSVATDPAGDARLLVWRVGGGLLLLQGRAGLRGRDVLLAGGLPVDSLSVLCATAERLRQAEQGGGQGGGGASRGGVGDGGLIGSGGGGAGGGGYGALAYTIGPDGEVERPMGGMLFY